MAPERGVDPAAESRSSGSVTWPQLRLPLDRRIPQGDPDRPFAPAGPGTSSRLRRSSGLHPRGTCAFSMSIDRDERVEVPTLEGLAARLELGAIAPDTMLL